MKKIFPLLIAIIFSSTIYGQISNLQIAHQTLEDRGEVYFKFTIDQNNLDQKSISMFSNIISIDDINGNEVIAYANAKEFNRFLDFGLEFEVLTAPSLLFKPSVENVITIRNIDDWDYYPSYNEYVDMMYQFEIDYPNLCEVVSIGATNEDRELLFVHINNNLGDVENDPQFMYTATMHGDEVVGYVLMLRYIDYLLSNYPADPEVTNLVNNIDIWINPLANPDGTFAAGNNSVWGATRTNAFNIDLNRNYPDPEDGPHPDGNAWQTETVAFMDFADDNNFVMSSNMHGGAEVVNYPWDTWAQLAADDDWWVFVSREYADVVHENSPSNYLSDFNDGITNGYAWYSISGGRQDYMNYFHNCREMTLELSNNKMPPESQLPDFWEYNYRSFNKYMEQSLYGFSGVITNAATGNTVAAEVFVDNHDIDNSEVFSHQPLGNYFRPIKSGTYDVTFSSFGYYDQTISDVNITDYSNYELNVEMIPYTSIVADFTASSTLIGTGSSVDFFNNSWGNDIVSWSWEFEGGDPATSSEENPTNISYSESGNFNVTLTITNNIGESDTKINEDYILAKEAYIMSNETVTTCNALFLDSGGENSDYSDNEDYTMTFYPNTPNSSVKIEFIEFNVENHFDCDYDYIKIFDGIDINAPLINKGCGAEIYPATYIANNEEGALTVYFHSDNNIVLSGWKAIVSCDTNVGISQFEKLDVNVFPNPASTKIQILSDEIITDIKLTDLSGRLLYSLEYSSGSHIINTQDIERGIYILSFNSGSNSITRKIILN